MTALSRTISSDRAHICSFVILSFKEGGCHGALPPLRRPQHLHQPHDDRLRQRRHPSRQPPIRRAHPALHDLPPAPARLAPRRRLGHPPAARLLDPRPVASPLHASRPPRRARPRESGWPALQSRLGASRPGTKRARSGTFPWAR
ncbi:hypothetical protein M8818_006379 [Zalaria obscura]|uniref:Uncharacterized protein n=1 Tax=Zalaria obscura TaxID=2024903 RepID=A0ACC3S5J6_9PEZI